MCHVWCKELRGWCRSFTRTEALLSLLEGVLFVGFIAFLVFLILHFIACATKPLKAGTPITTTTEVVVTPPPSLYTSTKTTSSESVASSKAILPTVRSTAARGMCSWEMSKKTIAPSRYYEQTPQMFMNDANTSDIFDYTDDEEDRGYESDIEFDKAGDLTDGEEAEDVYKRLILALVRMAPPRGVTFGCIVTIVSDRWVITAASCIEAIEEVDALDSFVLAEGYGGLRLGRVHAVDSVHVHPLYQGSNRSYDLAALRSEDSLARAGTAARLPTHLDYLFITLGERFTLLGYGPFRSVDGGPRGRRLHQAHVYRLPAARCARGAGWGARHLGRGWAEARGAGGALPLCAGVLGGRGRPCSWCAGAALVGAAGALLGVLAAGAPCGLACEPALYVNIAAQADWLHDVIH